MGKREAHVRALAKEVGAPLVLHKSAPPLSGAVAVPQGEAYRNRVVVYNWDASNPAYFVALHELGHFALGHPLRMGHYRATLLEREAEAWEWAFDKAHEDPTKRTLRYLRTEWLGSHARTGRETAGPTFHRVASSLGVAA